MATQLTPDELAIRNATYRRFVELGRSPSVEEVSEATGRAATAVAAGWRRLHDAHALVLDADGGLRMANPFSGVETAHRVEAAGREWFANCGWDAFGVGVVLRTDSTIHTICPDCGEALDIDVRGYRPTDPELVWHVLVPARDWWADIGFT